MKKIIIGVVGVALLAGIAFFFLSQQNRGKVAIESVLPPGPIFYVRMTDLNSRIEKFTATKLFNEFKNFDYKNLAAQMGASASTIDEANQKIANVFSPENQKLLKMLFGQELAVAVYVDNDMKNWQAQNPTEAQKLIMQLAENVFIATRVSSDFVVAETLLKFVGQFNKDFKTDTANYKGKQINTITSKDGLVTFSYVRLNDIIVMGAGQKAAKSAIDVLAKKQKALVLDANFTKSMQSFGSGADTVGFLDVNAIYKIGDKQIEEMAKEPSQEQYAQQIKDSLRQTQGLESLAFSTLTGELLTGKANVYFDKSKLDPTMRSFYSCAADDNRSLNFVPYDALFYQWSTCWDFSTLWSQYKEQVTMQSKARGRPMDVSQMVSGYEKMLGLSIDADILPVLGKEFGVYLTDLDTMGSFPVPKFVVFVQITSQQKATALINKLLALEPNLRPEEETYDGHLIRYIAIPFVDSFKVSYSFVNNYLLLASNVDVLKASFDAAKNPDKSIVINNAFRPAISKRNSVFFIQFDRLMGKAGEIVDWASKISEQTKIQRQAFLSGSQKNLDDIKARNEVLSSELKTKQQNLLLLQSSTETTPEIASQKEQLSKDIESAQKEIAVNQERSKSILKQIEVYKAQTPKEDEQTKMAQQFLKPLLHALSNIRHFLTFTNNGDGVLESTSQLKIE